jgi:hypothetical protein
MGEDLFGLGGIADAFFGPKASQSAYTREKFKEAQRQNEYTPLLAESVRGLGLPGGNVNLAASQAINAGVPIDQVSGANLLTTTANNPNALGGNIVTAAAMGAKVPYGSTVSGFNAATDRQAATEIEKTNRMIASNEAADARALVPVRGADGSLTYARKSEAVGLGAPITKDQVVGGQLAGNWKRLDQLNPFQQDVLGANPRPGNWFLRDPGTGKIMREGRSFDGITDVDTKLPVPGGAVFQQSSNPGGANAFTPPGTEPGKTELKDYRTAIGHADQVLGLGTKIIDVVNRNPTVVGAAGNLRLMGQEGVDLLNSLNTMLGGGKPGGYDETVAQTRNALRARLGTGAAMNLIPELFDSDLNSVRTMNGLLIYKAAAAIGQSGRDASDKDIATVRGITGDPASWFQGPNTYKDKVGTLMKIVGQQRDDDFKMLQPGAAIGPRAAPAAPVATGTTSSGVTWTVGP